ncbi:MAG: insulinase family protein, partial [Bacteroidota bacterium]
MMLDRSKHPPIQEISNLTLNRPEKINLSNGIPVYAINMGTQAVVKIEVVFHAGRPYEEKSLVARATASMLKEGTSNLSSVDIAEKVDFYGGTLSTPVNLDTSNIVLYALNKHLGALLPLLAEVVQQPIFPQRELDLFIQNSQNRLQVDLSKNDVVAYRTITECIFGSEHPYGYNSIPEMYHQLKREDLQQHFQQNYHADGCVIFISGKIEPNFYKLLDQHLGQMRNGKREMKRSFDL